MKNLFERLSLENQEKLKDLESLYPITIKDLINKLQCNYAWTELKYIDITTLVNYLYLDDYSPTSIENLFDND